MKWKKKCIIISMLTSVMCICEIESISKCKSSWQTKAMSYGTFHVCNVHSFCCLRKYLPFLVFILYMHSQ